MSWQAAGLVALGGAIGSVLRWAAVLFSAYRFGAAFPWGTLGVNLIGSFAIGLIAEWAAAGILPPNARIFLVTGVLGGFTTFSSFSFEALILGRDGRPLLALAYTLASVILGFTAAYLGTLAARGVAGHV